MDTINGDVTVDGAVDAADNWVINHTVPTSGIASVTLQLPSKTTANNLLCMYLVRTTVIATYRYFFVRFNGDSGSNYTRSYAMWQDDGTRSDAFSTDTHILIPFCGASSSEANTAGGGYFAIHSALGGQLYPNLTGSSSFQRDITAASGAQYWHGMYGGTWRDTSKITSITFHVESGNFVPGSAFSIRGL